MIALFSLLIICLFSMIIVKVGSLALETTGISKDISRFQALSAFSGVGFTTYESEVIMSHPFRRKIIRILMLVGSIGIATAIATLIITFTGKVKPPVFLMGININSMESNFAIIIIALGILLFISKTKLFNHFMKTLLKGPLNHIKRKASLYDYENILGLSKGYGITSFEVPIHNWIVNKSIGAVKLEKEGINILGLFRKIHGHEEYMGLPSNEFKLHAHDKIIIYSREDAIDSISKREKGPDGTKSRREAELQHKKINLINKIDEEKFAMAHKHIVNKKK